MVNNCLIGENGDENASSIWSKGDNDWWAMPKNDQQVVIVKEHAMAHDDGK